MDHVKFRPNIRFYLNTALKKLSIRKYSNLGPILFIYILYTKRQYDSFQSF